MRASHGYPIGIGVVYGLGTPPPASRPAWAGDGHVWYRRVEKQHVRSVVCIILLWVKTKGGQDKRSINNICMTSTLRTAPHGIGIAICGDARTRTGHDTLSLTRQTGRRDDTAHDTRTPPRHGPAAVPTSLDCCMYDRIMIIVAGSINTGAAAPGASTRIRLSTRLTDDTQQYGWAR